MMKWPWPTESTYSIKRFEEMKRKHATYTAVISRD